MSAEKEQFMDVMKKIKEDISIFESIDLSKLYDVEEEEYSKILGTLDNMLTKYENHEQAIRELFSKSTNTISIRNYDIQNEN